MGIFYSTKSMACSPQINYKNVVKNNHTLARLLDCFNYQKMLEKEDLEIARILKIDLEDIEILNILSQLRDRTEPVSKNVVSKKDTKRICVLASAGLDLKFISEVTKYDPDLILTTFRNSFLDYKNDSPINDLKLLTSQDWQAVESLLFLLKTPGEIAEITGIDTGLVREMSDEILVNYQSRKEAKVTLPLDDKIVLQLLHERGCSNREIARKLNCSPTTVGNELNLYPGGYCAYESQKQQKERYHKKHGYSKINKAKDYITALIKAIKEQEYSPESFYYFNRTHPNAPFYNQETVSSPTIYKYIRENLIPLNSDELSKGLKTEKEPLEFQAKPNRRCLGKSIDEMPETEYDGVRPKEFNWEIDTLLGSKKQGRSILGLRETRTKFSMAFLLENKDSANVNKIMESVIAGAGSLAPEIFKTIISDNGSEFALLDSLSSGIGQNVYFAHPSTPTDKPNVERFNLELRAFFPKGVPMTNLTGFDVRNAADKINNRPSKVLNWATPEELFLLELRKLLKSHKLNFAGKNYLTIVS